MTTFEIISLAISAGGYCLSMGAIVVALWTGRSAARQAQAAENQNVGIRLHELETLYAARLTDLQEKYTTVQMESNLHKLHVKHCEEELAKLTGHHSRSSQPWNEG